MKVIRALDQNQAYWHYKTFIGKIRLCAFSSWKPLHIIFKKCLENECFPKEWKKENMVSVYKRVIDNWLIIIHQYCHSQYVLKFLRNYFQLPLKYLDTNNLLNFNWSGFCPNDSFMYQLLSKSFWRKSIVKHESDFR